MGGCLSGGSAGDKAQTHESSTPPVQLLEHVVESGTPPSAMDELPPLQPSSSAPHGVARSRHVDQELWSRFEFVKRLGSGRFGQVIQCKHKESGKHYAIKKVATVGRDRARAAQREIRVLRAAAGHPNVVKLHGAFQSKRHIYLVFDLCRGGDILSRLQGQRYIEEPMAALICRQVTLALLHLHRRGIVHRDLKPENILLASEHSPLVKVADFGLSEFLEAGSTSHSVCGTWAYAAPEQKHGASGAPADVWSLGIVLYTMLCGYHPFDEYADLPDHELDLRIAALDYEFNDPVWDNISRAARALIRRMLVLDPAKRIDLQGVLDSPWLRRSGVLQPNTMPSRMASAESADVIGKLHEQQRRMERARVQRQQLAVHNVPQLAEVQPVPNLRTPPHVRHRSAAAQAVQHIPLSSSANHTSSSGVFTTSSVAAMVSGYSHSIAHSARHPAAGGMEQHAKNAEVKTQARFGLPSRSVSAPIRTHQQRHQASLELVAAAARKGLETQLARSNSADVQGRCLPSDSWSDPTSGGPGHSHMRRNMPKVVPRRRGDLAKEHTGAGKGRDTGHGDDAKRVVPPTNTDNAAATGHGVDGTHSRHVRGPSTSAIQSLQMLQRADTLALPGLVPPHANGDADAAVVVPPPPQTTSSQAGGAASSMADDLAFPDMFSPLASDSDFVESPSVHPFCTPLDTIAPRRVRSSSGTGASWGGRRHSAGLPLSVVPPTPPSMHDWGRVHHYGSAVTVVELPPGGFDVGSSPPGTAARAGVVLERFGSGTSFAAPPTSSSAVRSNSHAASAVSGHSSAQFAPARAMSMPERSLRTCLRPSKPKAPPAGYTPAPQPPPPVPGGKDSSLARGIKERRRLSLSQSRRSHVTQSDSTDSLPPVPKLPPVQPQDAQRPSVSKSAAFPMGSLTLGTNFGLRDTA